MSTDIESRLQQIEARLSAIEARNARVEMEKGWETSACRKGSVLALTYLVMGLVFYSLGNQAPWTNAVIPTLGFFLSTLSLPVIRMWWNNRQKS